MDFSPKGEIVCVHIQTEREIVFITCVSNVHITYIVYTLQSLYIYI